MSSAHEKDEQLFETPDLPARLRLGRFQWPGLLLVFAFAAVAVTGYFGAEKMETVFRVGAIYAFVTLGLRFLGKRELSELSPHELIMLMLVPEMASQALSHDDPTLLNAIVGISALLLLVFVTSALSYRFKIFRKMLEGDPVVLFAEGKFRQRAMDRERVNADEILSEARSSGIESFANLKWAILEPDGQITCIPLSGVQSVVHENKHPRI